jgi:hypothetical protein
LKSIVPFPFLRSIEARTYSIVDASVSDNFAAQSAMRSQGAGHLLLLIRCAMAPAQNCREESAGRRFWSLETASNILILLIYPFQPNGTKLARLVAEK